eukprot:1142296-Pelagomonas_calceolata.AAC.1
MEHHVLEHQHSPSQACMLCCFAEVLTRSYDQNLEEDFQPAKQCCASFTASLAHELGCDALRESRKTLDGMPCQPIPPLGSCRNVVMRRLKYKTIWLEWGKARWGASNFPPDCTTSLFPSILRAFINIYVTKDRGGQWLDTTFNWPSFVLCNADIC